MWAAEAGLWITASVVSITAQNNEKGVILLRQQARRIEIKNKNNKKLKIQRLFFLRFPPQCRWRGTLREIWNWLFGNIHWNGSVSLLLVPVLPHRSVCVWEREREKKKERDWRQKP
jgi:hypothetical protein